MTPAREAESQARKALPLRDFRDGLIAVALYFAAIALTSDAEAAQFKEPQMETETAITWHTHDDPPASPTRAIIAIRPPAGADETAPIALSELYDWDTAQGYWISASSHLKMRHKEFFWAPIDGLLRSLP